MSTKDQPVIAFASKAKWSAWLEKHHDSSAGVWLKIAKKASGIKSVTYKEALDCALCYGWIDGQKGSFDDRYFVQKFTPRTARSRWSKINRERALELIESGEMKPAGLREVQRAQADGRWEAAYDSPSRVTVPEDLQRALDRNKRAKDFFATLTGVNRYAVLYRIQDAKRPETRARRIEQFVEMLGRHETLHP